MDGPKRDRSGGPGLQVTSFDIFQVEAGGVVWRGAAATFEDAMSAFKNWRRPRPPITSSGIATPEKNTRLNQAVGKGRRDQTSPFLIPIASRFAMN